MAKHNDKEFQDKLKMSFRLKLEEQLKTGIAQGVYATCKVINDKAQDTDISSEERLANIIEFCKPVLIGKQKKVT